MSLSAPSASPPLWRLAVPTLVTLGNATCGFAAVLQMTSASAGLPTLAVLTTAAWLIQAGWIFDMCDGLIARMMKANSPFGAQLDSLCDVLTFGFAPAILVATHSGGTWLGWLAGLIYLWAAIIRLARFTVENGNETEAHMYFSGLPSPAAAALVAGVYLTEARLQAQPLSLLGLDAVAAQGLSAELAFWLPFVAIAVGVLMVSQLRYPDMPKHYLKGTKPRWHLAVLALSTWFLGPAVTIAVYFSGYTLVGMLRPALAKLKP